MLDLQLAAGAVGMVVLSIWGAAGAIVGGVKAPEKIGPIIGFVLGGAGGIAFGLFFAVMLGGAPWAG